MKSVCKMVLPAQADNTIRGSKLPVFAHTPPGAIGNQIILPLAVLMLALAL